MKAIHLHSTGGFTRQNTLQGNIKHVKNPEEESTMSVYLYVLVLTIALVKQWMASLNLPLVEKSVATVKSLRGSSKKCASIIRTKLKVTNKEE